MPLVATLLVLALLPFAAASAPPPAGERTGASVLSTQPPPAGIYDASLCVATAAGPANCGPVVADIDDQGRLDVRISDIVYRLEPYAEQLGITLFHGTMQIDGFFARYQWNGRTLQFSDPEKNTRYELKLGTRRFDTQ